jgi:hypothetical protein
MLWPGGFRGLPPGEDGRVGSEPVEEILDFPTGRALQSQRPSRSLPTDDSNLKTAAALAPLIAAITLARLIAAIIALAPPIAALSESAERQAVLAAYQIGWPGPGLPNGSKGQGLPRHARQTLLHCAQPWSLRLRAQWGRDSDALRGPA